MCENEKTEDYFSPEAIAERRKGEPPKVTEAWKHARSANHWNRGNTAEHWDGKPKKDSLPF